jgi:anti-sigma factor RsiW
MTCSKTQTNLRAYLDGELDAASRAQLSAHLRECAGCQNEMSEAREFDQFLRDIDDLYGEAPGVRVPHGFAQRVIARAQSGPDRRAAAAHRWLLWHWFAGFSVPIRLAVISALLLATLGGLRAGQVISELITRPGEKPLPAVNIDLIPAEQSLVLLMRGDAIPGGQPAPFPGAKQSRGRRTAGEDKQ